MTIYTTREAASLLSVTPDALRMAAHGGLLALRRPTPAERAALTRDGRARQGGTSVVDEDELERYRTERRPMGRPRRER